MNPLQQQTKNSLEIDLMKATLDKTTAETRKILRETVVVPFLVGAGLMGAITAFVGAVFTGILLLVKH